jgi:signal transduction histidine kinase
MARLGDAMAPACDDNGDMNLSGRRLRLLAAPLLGVLALLQLSAALSFSSHVHFGVPGQHATVSIHLFGTPVSPDVQGVVVLALLCLLSTVPAGSSGAAALAAAPVVCAACLLSLTLFQYLTAASLCALLLVVYRAGGWLAVLCTVPFLGLELAGFPHGQLGRVMVILVVALAPAVAVAGIARRRSALAVGALREDMADSAFEHMARGERATIARELHDVVAHHISMVSVQAETARLTTPGMPEDGKRRLTEIADTARAGLTEMRRLLGVLRSDDETAPSTARHPQPGLAQLGELLDEARAASETSVRLIMSGPVRALDPGVELAAYRIVQEALTNSRRHAPGAAADVELCYSAADLLLRVRDNGPGGPSGPGGSSGPGGHGLVGMRERAQAVGGSLRAGPAPGGGFLVEATLPAGEAGE